jgi:predicted Zn finger-like uncharacterized protein
MIIVCPSCQTRYKFDEGRIGDRPRVKTRCAKCGGTIEIENPSFAAFTLPPTPPRAPTPAPIVEQETKRRTAETQRGREPTPVGTSTVSGLRAHQLGVVELPKDKRFSLAVIQGAATGQIFQVGKTRTTLGRSGADINLDDPEASRQHAVVEISGDRAVLRDLGSTNGTFVESDRVEQRELTNQMEFRIGSHVLMFIVTDVE